MPISYLNKLKVSPKKYGGHTPVGRDLAFAVDLTCGTLENEEDIVNCCSRECLLTCY